MHDMYALIRLQWVNDLEIYAAKNPGGTPKIYILKEETFLICVQIVKPER